jgi:hypothetical protein
MIIIERMIQEIYPDKWAELAELDKKYDALEPAMGFPPKKRYQSLAGVHSMSTLIIERQWESLAKMEAAEEKAMQNPEYQALYKEGIPIIKSVHWELYMPLP